MIYPPGDLTENRVISSLFNVVIDTQSQIYPPRISGAANQCNYYIYYNAYIYIGGR